MNSPRNVELPQLPLRKQRDPHIEIEFDFDEKHVHLK